MLEKIFNILEPLWDLLDIVAEIIVSIALTLFIGVLILAFIFAGFQYSTTVGIIVLIVSLSFIRVIT